MKAYVWNDRNSGVPAEPMDLEAVPREGDTVAVRGAACARVKRVHWDLVTGIVHVYVAGIAPAPAQEQAGQYVTESPIG